MRRDPHRSSGLGHLDWARRCRPPLGHRSSALEERWVGPGCWLAVTLSALLTGCSQEPRGLVAIDPPMGSVLGDESAVLQGSGFTDDVRVFFAGDPAAAVQRADSRQLHLRTPTVAVRGEVAVSAQWGDGEILTLPHAYTFHALKLSNQTHAFVPSQVVAMAGITASTAALQSIAHLAIATAQPPEVQLLRGLDDGRVIWTDSLPLRASPSALVGVDVNGDGRIDLAVAEAARSAISIWLAQADGNFRAEGEIITRCPPATITAASLIEDALPDLVVGCQDVLPGSAPVDVLPNRWPQGPAARFGPPVSLPIPGPTAIGTASVASTDA